MHLFTKFPFSSNSPRANNENFEKKIPNQSMNRIKSLFHGSLSLSIPKWSPNAVIIILSFKPISYISALPLKFPLSLTYHEVATLSIKNQIVKLNCVAFTKRRIKKCDKIVRTSTKMKWFLIRFCTFAGSTNKKWLDRFFLRPTEADFTER